MANVSALIGSGLKVPTTSIALIQPNSVCANLHYLRIPGVLSGTLTAGVYKELFSVASGGGILMAAVVYSGDGTARTLGLRIVIDGNTVLDHAGVAGYTVAYAGMGIGFSDDSTTLYPLLSPVCIPFKTSLSLQVRSSLSETDKVSLKYGVAY